MVAKCDMGEYALDTPVVVLYSCPIVMTIALVPYYKAHTFVLKFASLCPLSPFAPTGIPWRLACYVASTIIRTSIDHYHKNRVLNTDYTTLVLVRTAP